MVTFVGAIGALVMKFATARIYSGFGFKRILIAMVGLSAALLVTMGLFSPAVPFVVIYTILLTSGFARSLMFTGINALVFADVDADQEGATTAIAAVFQQMSLALGVAVAGMMVEISMSWRGAGPNLPDFQFAFFVVAGIAAPGSFSALAARCAGRRRSLRPRCQAGSVVAALSPGKNLIA